MKLSEFLKESNGRYSSTRLFTVLIVLAFIIDWMYNVFATPSHKFCPDPTLLGAVLGSLGLKVWQKGKEDENQ